MSVHPIAAAFLSEPLKSVNIAPHGICEMSIRFNGSTIEASWYSGDNPSGGIYRSLRVNGTGLPVVGSDAEEIVRAAQKRSERYAQETLDKLLRLAGTEDAET